MDDKKITIGVFQPSLREEELAAVERVFASNWLGKGKVTEQFEKDFADHLGSDASLIRSVSCCTEGLFQSLSLLEIGAGDEVILPTISFVGAGNAIASSGAKPVFCDVNPRTLNPTVEMVEAKITPKTKAVMLMHYGGVPCDLDAMVSLMAEYKIKLIEDCACSVSSRWRGQACGTFGDVAVWSFDAMKILVTGDGGMIRCRTPEMAKRAESLLYLGLKTQSGLSSQAKSRWWEFEIDSPSRRAIMNDIAAAIGVEQLKKLPDFIERRRAVYQFYNEALVGETWLERPPSIPQEAESSYYFYWIQTEPLYRDRLARYLRDRDIYTTFRYYPLHWVKFFARQETLPYAEMAANTTLCLPIHQSLTENELSKVVDCIQRFGREEMG
ncbi:DegT/DnrJ/EryC1/StrS family aminotransferase [Oscillatoria salina]|uniref:DegT/DnrJ/EryC1/StrS family aminotransferase n=1 Tax=Oscillatoria salina TaxID=331517 RepID=UPI0013B64BC3|nr:DegT/DnrJ/EryC1/StrS family aminotransferase [Oscillatoria salina]MBZ8181786.1 DegT/DnrJ/EryC1/StrS family aminotransferase [Oscillatoria salina IIICB1]NET89481.1 DegT/DnrJ/EryC1/StrS family aminotransferase [Kamptonema sp. SIO1D9]